MTDSLENLSENQTTFTFCRQESKDNPENMFESVVDDPAPNQTNTKTHLLNQPHTLDSLYQQKIKDNHQESTQQIEPLTLTPLKAALRERGDASDQEERFEMPEFHSYLDLTAKLESALNKISGPKRSVNSTGRSSNIILRFEELELKKKAEMKRLKEEVEREAVKELKSKPIINKHSHKISQETGHEPIHLRYEKIMAEKEKQQQLNKELKEKAEMEKEAQFFEEFEKHCKKPENIRSYDEYFNEMVRWKEKKTQEAQQKFERQRNEEMQGLTFHPTISAKSKRMMEGQRRPPISQRGLVREKPKPLYTFTPNVGSRQPK